MMTACSAGKEVTSHDRQYIFLPAEIEDLPAADYHLKVFKNGRSYVFLTNYTVEERQVKKNLIRKLDYIRQNADSLR